MGKKKKKREELLEMISKNKDRLHLVLQSNHEIDSIVITMIYNAQHSIFRGADADTTDFLQRLLDQASEKLIYTMSNDVQTLAIIEHWGLKHPALNGRLNELMLSRAMDDAPDGIHIKDLNEMARKYISGVMFEADRRATESVRQAMSAAEQDTRFTLLTVKSSK